MSNDDDNALGAGRTLDGRAAEPLPSSWTRPSAGQRVGRIGDWTKYEFSFPPLLICFIWTTAPVAEERAGLQRLMA